MYDDPDRRIRRTRRALAAALISLTSERPYHSIGVRDITDQADVGYATFYRHYENKDDLMLAVFAKVAAELEASAGEPGEEYFEQEGQLIFEHVQKYEGLYRSILQNRNFVDKLKKLLARQIEDQIQRHALEPVDLAFPIELAANHMVAGLMGLIEWWLEKDMPLTVAEMGRIYERLIIRATWYALPAGNKLSLPWHS
ncbi:MAG: TetR/AcrR family transcriptional regulator [Anaerolineales bacterium]|jgi:AcrR family transcriptional regulator